MSKKVCEMIQKMRVSRRAGDFTVSVLSGSRPLCWRAAGVGGGGVGEGKSWGRPGEGGVRSSVAVSWAHIPFGLALWHNSHTVPFHSVSNP